MLFNIGIKKVKRNNDIKHIQKIQILHRYTYKKLMNSFLFEPIITLLELGRLNGVELAD